MRKADNTSEQQEPTKQHGVLGCVRARLRSIPALGAIAFGLLMLLAGAIMLCPRPILGFDLTGVQQVVFFGSFPLFFLGAWTLEFIGRLTGRSRPPPNLDPAESHGMGLAPVLIFVTSLIINVFVVWAGLKVICSGVALVRRTLSKRNIDASARES